MVGVPEWLSGMTRNHVGFARAGSNPAAHDFISLFSFFCFPDDWRGGCLEAHEKPWKHTN